MVIVNQCARISSPARRYSGNLSILEQHAFYQYFQIFPSLNQHYLHTPLQSTDKTPIEFDDQADDQFFPLVDASHGAHHLHPLSLYACNILDKDFERDIERTVLEMKNHGWDRLISLG